MKQHIPNELATLVTKLKVLLKLEKTGCIDNAIQRIESTISDMLKEAA
jgi:hypothetical protein